MTDSAVTDLPGPLSPSTPRHSPGFAASNTPPNCTVIAFSDVELGLQVLNGRKSFVAAGMAPLRSIKANVLARAKVTYDVFDFGP